MIIIIKTKDTILVVNELKIELNGKYIYFNEVKVNTGSEENSKLIFNRIYEKIKEYDSRYPGIRFDIQEMIKSCNERLDIPPNPPPQYPNGRYGEFRDQDKPTSKVYIIPGMVVRLKKNKLGVSSLPVNYDGKACIIDATYLDGFQVKEEGGEDSSFFPYSVIEKIISIPDNSLVEFKGGN